MEFLKNAWDGWYSFSTGGRLTALFLIALLFLWIYYKRILHRPFLAYATAAALCCCLPPTAAVLMMYQTRFYDYEWIWSLVPMTALIGYAATIFVSDILPETVRGDRRKSAVVLIGLLAITLLCGGMGFAPWDSAREQTEREAAEKVLPQLKSRMGEKGIFLWAPREILEYAREYDAGIRMLYGRDMWEQALCAYSYGGYGQEAHRLYDWMEGAAENVGFARTEGEDGEIPSARECAEILKDTDINCILLPGDTEEETIGYFEEILGMRREKLENYYLLVR
ncbi:MAG: hypothetical protein NC432_13985 [Roseburia sp.]|nr:hypothetical protein [Roseburia sp.]